MSGNGIQDLGPTVIVKSSIILNERELSLAGCNQKFLRKMRSKVRGYDDKIQEQGVNRQFGKRKF